MRMSEKRTEPRNDSDEAFELKHIKIEGELDYRSKSFKSKCELYIDPKGASVFRIEAVNFLINSVKVNGKLADYTYDGRNITISVPDNFSDLKMKITVDYAIVDPQCWILMPFQSDTNVYRDQAPRWCFIIFAPVIAAAFLNDRPKHLRYILWYP